MYKSGLDFVLLLPSLYCLDLLVLVLNNRERRGIIIDIRRPTSVLRDLNTQNIEYVLTYVPRLHRDDPWWFAALTMPKQEGGKWAMHRRSYVHGSYSYSTNTHVTST